MESVSFLVTSGSKGEMVRVVGEREKETQRKRDRQTEKGERDRKEMNRGEIRTSTFSHARKP